jgi:hypothetical protein
MNYTEFMNMVNNAPAKDLLATLDNGESYYIPINTLEGMLDILYWNTSKFQYQIFKDGYANLCVAASLELEITHENHKGEMIKRTFVGACNFNLLAIEPNTHFLATAKSECIKNAASDINKYYGRGLNETPAPSSKKIEKKAVKAKPDAKIMQQFAKALTEGDEATQTMLSNMYEIKMPNNVEESKN